MIRENEWEKRFRLMREIAEELATPLTDCPLTEEERKEIRERIIAGRILHRPWSTPGKWGKG